MRKNWKGLIAYGWRKAGPNGVIAALVTLCSRIPEARSAVTAKYRLHWCVAARRHGGHWVCKGVVKRRYVIKPGAPVIEQEKGYFRWMSAQ